MIFDQDSIEIIRKKIDADTYLAEGFEMLRSDVLQIDEEYLSDVHTKLLEYESRAKKLGGAKVFRYGNFMRELSNVALKLVFYDKLFHCDIHIHRAKIITELICNAETWCFQGVFNGWNSDLWTADIGTNISMVYESLKPYYTKCEQDGLKRCIFEKGFKPIYDEWIDPITHIHALDSMGHNWWSVCVSGAGIMLLHLEDYTEYYSTYLDNIIDGLYQWFSYKGNVLQNKKGNFGDDGSYIEYIGYLLYALANFTVFKSMLERNGVNRLSAVDKILEKLPDFYIATLHILENGPKSADFGDMPYSVTSNAYPLFYMAERFNRNDLLFYFKQIYKKPVHPFDYYFYNPSCDCSHSGRVATDLVFNHGGFATLRTGFSCCDTALIMRVGEIWNHNHQDTGSFELSSMGHKFITDSGTCTYSKKEYLGYYLTTEAHNTITHEGKGHLSELSHAGTKFPGNFASLISTPNYKYLLADCTGPCADRFLRFYRHVLFIDKVVFIIDDIQSVETGAFQWLLHFDGDGREQEYGFDIINNENILKLFTLFPLKSEVSLEDGFLHEMKNSGDDDGVLPKAPYLKISAQSGENRRIKFINAFVLPYKENDNIQIEKYSHEDVREIIIRNQLNTTKILVNLNADGRVMHLNSNINCSGVETDGFITIIKTKTSQTPEDEVVAVGLHNGSLLKYRGQMYLSSLVKIDGFFDCKSRNLYCDSRQDTVIHITGNRSASIKSGSNNLIVD